MTVVSPGDLDVPAGGGDEHTPGTEPAEPAASERAEPRRQRARRRAVTWRRAVLAAAVYAGLALLVYWPVQPLSRTSVVSCGCYDVAEQMWFLSWTPHAIAHLTNPFFTNALDVPYGANLAANTTMPLLGLLASPITMTLGPVAAYNFLIRLALFSSALSMCLVLRRYRLRWPVAFLGGLVYGFSPYELTQGSLHLNLCFVCLLPLIVACIDELAIRNRRRPAPVGLVLGLLATAQYYVSSELLADLGVLSAIALAALAIRYPRRALRRAGRVASGVGIALVPFALLTGYPIAFGILGPQHYVKTWQVTNGNETIRNDLLSPIVPTTWQLLAPARWSSLGSTLVGGVAENGGYLGIPLVCCWLATLVWAALRRRGRALLFALTAAVAFVLSLGPSLQVHGVDRGVSLPFGLSSRIPLLDVAVAARYSLFVVAALVLGASFALDALFARVERPSGAVAPRHLSRSGGRPPTRASVGLLPALGVAGIVVVALMPLVPSHAEASARVRVPSYFTSAAVRQIPAGTNVLAYPYPLELEDFSMLWQAEAGFRFNLLGGYVLTPLQLDPPPNAGQGGGDTPPTLAPPLVQILFYSANANANYTRIPPQPWATRQVEQFVRNYGVGTVIVDTAREPAPAAPGAPITGDVNLDPGAVTAVFRALYGPPVVDGPLRIWYRADQRKPVSGFG